MTEIFELELLLAIVGPCGTETFPREHVYATFAEKRPHGHFDGSGVGRGDDAKR